MIKKTGLLGWILFCGVLTLTLTACPKKQVVKKTVAEEELADKDLGVESQELDIHGKDFIASPDLRSIFFDYDSSELSAEARETLAKNAEYLKKNPQFEVLVEGHTDERGTVGYNLALGQKRAQMVRKYYQSLGLEPKRMGALSYGKEKPSCFESSEGCWSKNRRGETKISAPAVGQSGKKDE